MGRKRKETPYAVALKVLQEGECFNALQQNVLASAIHAAVLQGVFLYKDVHEHDLHGMEPLKFLSTPSPKRGRNSSVRAAVSPVAPRRVQRKPPQ